MTYIIITMYFIIGSIIWFIIEVKRRRKFKSGDISEFQYNLWKYDIIVLCFLLWPPYLIHLLLGFISKFMFHLVDLYIEQEKK